MKRALCGAALACAITLAGCGGAALNAAHNQPVVSHDLVVPTRIACPAEHGYMGCSVQPSPTAAAPEVANSSAPSGAKFPDVSDWQGHPNWTQAKPYIWGAIAKLGEYSLDPDVQYNVGQFRQLGIRWSVYLFVRPQGCATEQQNALSWLRAIGGPSSSGPVLVLDEEEPGLSGYASCIDQAVFRAYHRHAVIYTSPGTWSGGSNAGLPLWIATYGSSFSAIWHPVVAWQFTDGHFGEPYYIPGLGYGDVSVSYSLFNPAPPKPPTPATPSCWGKDSHSAACKTVRRAAYLLHQQENQQAGYLTVSRHNAAVLVAQIAALQARLAEVNARAHSESSKTAALHTQRCQLLAKYHRSC